jgi:hypothetical protein
LYKTKNISCSQISGINNQEKNLMSLFAGEDCQLEGFNNGEFTGEILNFECTVSNNSHEYNGGCQIIADQTTTYGKGFNEGISFDYNWLGNLYFLLYKLW